MRKERAQLLLESKIQLPNESVLTYIEEMKRLFRRADANMSEERRVHFLMRGIKEQLFAGLVFQPPKTVVEFTEEASMQKTLDIRTRQYNRPAQKCSVYTDTTTTINDWREVVREIVRNEMRRLLGRLCNPKH